MKDSVTTSAGPSSRLGVYRRLTHLPLIRHSYARKFAYAAIVGAQIPLLFFILYLLIGSPDPNNLNSLIVALAFACLAGFLGTLSLVREILVPIDITAEALQEFLHHRKLPSLPTHYRDAAGRLMEGTQYTLVRLDETFRNLEGLSSTDALTGIYNRRAGEQRLSEEVARADRDGTPFEFAFFDMNRFKEINDTLGHAAGDACIRHVADRLKVSIRASDWTARWGGDEFVVGLHRGQAPGVFERIAKVISSTPCVIDDDKVVTLHVSVGVATYRVGQGMAALVADADRAMYAAKELSRENGGSNVFHFVEPSALHTATPA